MKLAASSRTASATVLLALIVTGWCMAAAVPVADARRRLQDIPAVTTGKEGGGDGSLQSQLSNLLAIVELEPVLRKFGVTKTVVDLLDLDVQLLAESIAGSPLEELPVDAVCRIIGLTSQLQTVVGGLEDLPIVVDGQGQLRTRMAALGSLLNDVQGQLRARGSACAEQKP